MTRKLVFSAALAIVFACSAGASWAQKGNKNSGKKADEVPEAINRQFQWEEKVVGPKDKGVDHKKIAAMQERARREEAAHQNDPPPTASKKRGQGVSAPASATLPTMDIEKPAPAAASTSHKTTRSPSHAEQEQARPRDAIDNLLADEAGPKSASGGGRAGLRNVFASDDDKPSRPTHAVAKKPRSKKH